MHAHARRAEANCADTHRRAHVQAQALACTRAHCDASAGLRVQPPTLTQPRAHDGGSVPTRT
eukprot:6196829-Pleurochrysis_carterae.AAC.7